jgi:hypothetical protein
MIETSWTEIKPVDHQKETAARLRKDQASLRAQYPRFIDPLYRPAFNVISSVVWGLVCADLPVEAVFHGLAGQM